MKKINNPKELSEKLLTLNYWEKSELYWKYINFQNSNSFYYVDYPFKIKSSYFKIDSEKYNEVEVEEGIWSINHDFVYFDFNKEQIPKPIKLIVDLGFDEKRELTLQPDKISSFWLFDIRKQFEKLPTIHSLHGVKWSKLKLNDIDEKLKISYYDRGEKWEEQHFAQRYHPILGEVLSYVFMNQDILK